MESISNKWLVIVNPHAGTGKCGKDWPKIKKHLTDQGFQIDTHLTEFPGHAIQLVRKIYESHVYLKIIVVGGDGTLNEVVNGLMLQEKIDPKDVKIGMITIGTGNDWGRMYHIPQKYKKAIKVIKKEKSVLQDIGMVNYRHEKNSIRRYFVNMAGMGFDALVAKKTNLMKAKGRGGTLLYLWNLLAGLFQYQAKKLEIVCDGKEIYSGKVFSLSVGICKYNGGGMMQLPNAIPDDGLFDMTIIKNASKMKVVRNIKNLYDGSFVHLDEVITCTGKKIAISSQPPHSILIETDGESLGSSPLDFDILPGQIRVIA